MMGMMPHSHMGKTRPSRPPRTMERARLGRRPRDQPLRHELLEIPREDRSKDDEGHRLVEDAGEGEDVLSKYVK